jgi:sugar lactone lactonase YvrE
MQPTDSASEVPTKQAVECGLRPVVAWEKLPAGWSWTEVAAVAVDSKDRVYLFNRGDHPLMVFDSLGNFVTSWDEIHIARAHGITIGPDDCVYLTDDLDHTVRKYSSDGQLLMTLGTSGVPSATGATSIDYRSIVRSGPPFYFPTNVAIADNGDIYATDGYGNARVHRFDKEGRLLQSWGEPGSGPGQFHVPHGIAMDSNQRIIIADRENSRLQFFSADGDFLEQWTDIARPCQVAIANNGHLWVAELGYRAGMWPGTSAPIPNATGGRVSVFDAMGKPLFRFGGGEYPTAPGDFFAPHDICMDSQGNVYVAEVTLSGGGNRGLVDPACHSLQKFAPM